ncbi:MAG: ABC transporter ATP-binding protein [Candidatus Gracilibacteria bacterium]|nr:ABC transporter ATP-binding protein [Candidatus Gracilibacteria bacterium]
MFVLANVVIMLQPFLIGKFMNIIQSGGPNVIRDSAIVLGIFALADFVFWIFHGPARCMERTMSFNLSRNFLTYMFNLVTKLPLKWHKDNHSGKTIDKINKAADALKSFTDELYVYVETIIQFVASVVAIVLITKWDGLIVFVFAFAVLVVISKFDKPLVKSLQTINKKYHEVASTFFDYISNATTIITLRLEKLAKSDYVKRINFVYPLYRKMTVINEAKWFSVSMVMSLAYFVIIMYFVYKTYGAGGTIMVGTLVMLYEYVRRFIEVFYGVAWKYERFVVTAADVTAVNDIIEDYGKISRKLSGALVQNGWKKISIKNLCFKYEDEKNRSHTLDKVSLELGIGQKIALVGESGSGKSTMMTILRGLTNANKVDLVVDGERFFDLRALSGITTLIPQMPEIFENTIEYNITMGISHSKKDVMKAVEIACFDKVLKKLPNGLETNIREKGVNLSGGERQRLALARGIFAAHMSSLILLDEPTSSVDGSNEVKIYEGIFEAFKDKCIVSSIHRLHMLKFFDYVYVFDHGSLVEQGTFEALKAKENGVLQKQLMQIK